MKISLIVTALSIFALTTVTSCKKDYTCTCTTVVTAVSTDTKHDISNSTYSGAVRTCKTFEDEANSGLPGSTTCRL